MVNNNLTSQKQQPLNSVCDLCYSRKVKCDRDDPCGNCQDARVKCLRTRSRQQPSSRRGRQNLEDSLNQNFQGFNDRLERLEMILLRGHRPSTQNSSEAENRDWAVSLQGFASEQPGSSSLSLAGNAIKPSESLPNGRKSDCASRKRPSSVHDPYETSKKRNIHDTHSTSTPHSHSFLEAQEFIERELSVNQQLEGGQRAVLDSAITFVRQLSRSPRPTTLVDHNTTCAGSVMDGIVYPSTELLYWIIRESRGTNFGCYVLDYFKHISNESLRKMGLSLLNKDAGAQTLLLYSICVNSVAVKFLRTILSNSDDEAPVQEMHVSIDRYLASIRLALGRVHLLAPPSLVLLQAEICGAFITQGDGDTVSCWTLVSSACKTCMDLDLHRKDFWSYPIGQDQEEAFYCFLWCYMLDKNYSMNLGRRSCLLDCDGPSRAFMPLPERPISALLSIYIELAEIQGRIISELNPKSLKPHQHCRLEMHDTATEVLEQLERVHERILGLRSSSSDWRGLYQESELSTLGFCYHSLKTIILRARTMTEPKKPLVSMECLQSARSSVSALRAVQIDASHSEGDPKSYVAFMHWTILYYPLTPFFVLFCNVVANLDRGDFELLTSATNGLSDLSELSPSIARLQKLFSTFVSFLQPLMSNSLSMPAPMEPMGDMELASTSMGGPREDFENNSMEGPPSESIADLSFDMGTFSGMFDAQPRLNWSEADFSSFVYNIRGFEDMN